MNNQAIVCLRANSMADFRSWDLRMNQSKYIHVITSVYRDQIIIVG